MLILSTRLLKLLPVMVLAFSLSALADSVISLQSFNYPDHFIQHFYGKGIIGSVNTDLYRQDATFKMVAGLGAPGDTAAVSFESVNFPGNYLRHSWGVLYLQPLSNDPQYLKDATFKLVPGLASSSLKSIESYFIPGAYLRHSFGNVILANNTGDDQFKKDATFKVVPPVNVIGNRATLAAADAAGGPQRRLKLLTPKIPCPDPTAPDQCQLADPSAPMLDGTGLRITGTGFGFAHWGTWDNLLRGDAYTWIPFKLFQNVGLTTNELANPAETVWDITIEAWAGDTLYGGAVTPTAGHDHAIMWDDNIDRRLYAFTKKSTGEWLRKPTPVSGELNTYTWAGHSYGHQFLKDDATGKRYVFYEKVDQLRNGVPLTTQIYAREMTSPTTVAAQETPILGVGNPPYPATNQQNSWGSYLVEGARPVKAVISGQTFYILGFSSGNFTKETYGINVAWSKNILGPYHVFLNADARDFEDLGANIRNKYLLSWGPGRPSFFQDPNGKWWVLFHAIDNPNSQQRNIYLAPVQFYLDGQGNPTVLVSDANVNSAAPMWTTGTYTP